MKRMGLWCSVMAVLLTGSGAMLPGADCLAEAQERLSLPGCTLLAETEGLALYQKADGDVLGLADRESGAVWWTVPEEPSAADAPVRITCGMPKRRTEATYASLTDATAVVQAEPDGAVVTYTFAAAGITIPVRYTLTEDALEVSVDVAAIRETRAAEPDGVLLTELALLGGFGAADETTDGYFLLPDGCGALVRFHNGKTSTRAYRRMVYGEDLTAVPEQMPEQVQPICFPVYGIFAQQKGGLLAVCTDGDAAVQLCANVTGQSGDPYSRCYFQYVLRETDTYQLAGAGSTALLAISTGDKHAGRLAVRYAPLSDTQEDGVVDYADAAAAYRTYLQAEQQVTATVQPEAVPVYVELYAATEQQRSFLGIPYTAQTALTTCEQAQELLQPFLDAGAGSLQVSLHGWSAQTIAGQVADAAKPARCIGGSDGMQALAQRLRGSGGRLYPMVQNTEFFTGNGYYAFSDAAVRIPGMYARRYPYDLVTGQQRTEEPGAYLLTPAAFPAVAGELSEAFSGAGYEGIGLIDWAGVLYGDYGKNPVSRADALAQITESLQTLHETQAILSGSAGANAYALPYVEQLQELPLHASGYDLLDEEVPFCQMVLHGVKPYGMPAVNGCADPDEAVLRAVACGSSLHYTLMAADSTALQRTPLRSLYYAAASGWTETAAAQAAWADGLLSGVCDQYLVSYRESGGILTAVYADGTRIVTDLNRKTVRINSGKAQRLPSAAPKKGA